MNNQWMIDVLRDMRQVAQSNAMFDFAECLDDAIIVAAAELRDQNRLQDMAKGYEYQTGSVSESFGGYGHSQRPPDAC